MGDISTAIGGISSIAGALGGGSQPSGGGTVVGGPTPAAANQAGQYQVQAAAEAAAAMQKAVSEAISNINQNYTASRIQTQPYSLAGIQALDQLNQYIGLDPYNPEGTKPTSPIAPNAANKISDAMVKQYVAANTQQLAAGPDTHSNYEYTGIGAAPTASWADKVVNGQGQTYSLGWQPWKNAGQNDGPQDTTGLSRDVLNGADFLSTQPGLLNTVRNYLYDQNKDQYEQAYADQTGQYNLAKSTYDQSKAWYDQYSAEGPLTGQQISDKITATPGYSAELNQGLDAIQKASSARGYLGSGRALQELSQFGQNTLSKYYNNTLDRLQMIANNGQQAATSQSQGYQNQGNALAGVNMAGGEVNANSLLAAGNARAQATLAANQQYQVIGGSSGGGGGLK